MMKRCCGIRRGQPNGSESRGAGSISLVAFLLLAVGFPTLCNAHRPGETYAYINVGNGPLSGEVHVRQTHIDALETYGAHPEASSDYRGFEPKQTKDLLGQRLIFHSDGQQHSPVFTDEDTFGEGNDLFRVFYFEIPDLRPKETLDVSFTLIFDGPNPHHRTLLLMAENSELRLLQNESKPSLIFGPGDERQSLILTRRPWSQVSIETFFHGVRQVLISPPHVLIIAALAMALLQQGATRGLGTWGALLVAFGLAAGAGMFLYSGGSAGPKQTLVAFAAAGLATALASVVQFGLLTRTAAALVAAGLLGSVAAHFADRVGLEAGLLFQILPGFTVGVLAATLGLWLAVGGASGLAQSLITARAIPAIVVILSSVGVLLGWHSTRLVF